MTCIISLFSLRSCDPNDLQVSSSRTRKRRNNQILPAGSHRPCHSHGSATSNSKGAQLKQVFQLHRGFLSLSACPSMRRSILGIWKGANPGAVSLASSERARLCSVSFPNGPSMR
ncbi:hypothetical protein Micbo1qcDRAFT_159409 [Microdochium bolleyi]|uniref:Uncharacterized protein n=1 Tax=Microdochium bolleyi TaxID=196109 RepID=A0A136JAV9_9PEZI|nr:hypothetical protein Micbo1qcDRAFT_159409 [Microdochium bolleyi]